MHGHILLLKMIIDQSNPENNRAYIKYRTKEQALIAIKHINGIFRLHDYAKPLEVMLAEQKKTVMRMASYLNRENTSGEVIFKEYFTDNGIPYYFNPRTGKTQWEKPDAKIEPGEPVPIDNLSEKEGEDAAATQNNI